MWTRQPEVLYPDQSINSEISVFLKEGGGLCCLLYPVASMYRPIHTDSTLIHVMIRSFYLVSVKTVDLEMTINQGFDQIGNICSFTHCECVLGTHVVVRNSSWSSLSDVVCVCVCSSFPDGGVHPDVQQAQAEHLESAAGCAAVHEGVLPGVRFMFLRQVQLQSVLWDFVVSILSVSCFASGCCCSRKAARTWTCSLGSSQRPALLLPTLSVRPSCFQRAPQSQ